MPLDASNFHAAQGLTNYHDGLAAEASVERHYQQQGKTPVAQRWRSAAGEVDLIMRDGDAYVFVEVKKSRTFEQAAHNFTSRQCERVALAAQAYVEQMHPGEMIDMRLDLALVDSAGRIDVLENITLH